MKSNILSNILTNKILILGLIFIMCSLADVQAAKVTVKVKSGSSPLIGADVCLGDSSGKSKYGYKTTNNQGKAVFEDITATPVKVTVSKTGYNGAQSTFFTSTDVVVPFNLATGDQGPRCTKSSRVYTTDNRPIRKSTALPKKETGTSSPSKTKELPSGTLEPIQPIADKKPTVCTWKRGSLGLNNLESLAKGNGFKFEKTSEDFGSLCELSWEVYEIRVLVGYPDDNIVDALASTTGSKCDFQLFGGKKLQPGWKISKFGSYVGRSGVCVNSSASFTKKPKIGSNDLETKVHVWAEAGNKCSMNINEIQLVGPPDKECRDAF